MADDIVFEINAEDIIAKLHLSGRQAGKGYDKNTSFIVNSGIKGDDLNATPESPGKVKFMLDNSSGQYELGFVTQLGPYGIPTAVRRVVPQLNAIFAKFETQQKSADASYDGKAMPPELAKAYSEAAEVLGDKQVQADLKNECGLDVLGVIKQFAKQRREEDEGKMKDIDSKLGKDGIDKKKAEQLSKDDASKKDTGKEDSKSKEDGLKSEGQSSDASKKGQGSASDNDVDQLLQSRQSLQKDISRCDKIAASPLDAKNYTVNLAFSMMQAVLQAVTKAVKDGAKSDDIAASQSKARAAAQTLAVQNLRLYMKAFAGPEASKSFKDDDVIMIYVSQDVKSPNDKKLVDNFQILPAKDSEFEKHRQQQETDPSNCIDKVCFKIGFIVKIDK